VEGETETKIPFRQVWEDYSPYISHNLSLDCVIERKEYDCKHIKVVDGKRILPNVLVMINEGGFNSTGLCLDCLKEWLAAGG